MDQSCSAHYAYIACCIVIALNIVYFIITVIKLFIQYNRRQLPTRFTKKMTDQQNDTTTKTGLERLAQLYPHVTEDTPLPSKWSSKEKASPLVLQQNSLTVTYKGRRKELLKITSFPNESFYIQDLENHIKMQQVYVLIILFHHSPEFIIMKLKS